MEFRFEDYYGNYVMHCKTREEDKEFRELMHNDGRKWCDGYGYLEIDKWLNYKEDTCYYFNRGMYSPIDFYKEEGYIVLEWSDFSNKNNKKDLTDDYSYDIVELIRNAWKMDSSLVYDSLKYLHDTTKDDTMELLIEKVFDDDGYCIECGSKLESYEYDEYHYELDYNNIERKCVMMCRSCETCREVV